MAKVKGSNKEPRKQQEQIESIIRKYPEMEKHVVRTPFGTMLKPSWGKASDKLNIGLQHGKDINKYRKGK